VAAHQTVVRTQDGRSAVGGRELKPHTGETESSLRPEPVPPRGALLTKLHSKSSLLCSSAPSPDAKSCWRLPSRCWGEVIASSAMAIACSLHDAVLINFLGNPEEYFGEANILRLSPGHSYCICGTTEVVPFQNGDFITVL